MLSVFFLLLALYLPFGKMTFLVGIANFGNCRIIAPKQMIESWRIWPKNAKEKNLKKMERDWETIQCMLMHIPYIDLIKYILTCIHLLIYVWTFKERFCIEKGTIWLYIHSTKLTSKRLSVAKDKLNRNVISNRFNFWLPF